MRVAVAGYPILSSRQWKLCSAFERAGVETHAVVPDEWPGLPSLESEDVPFETHHLPVRFPGQQGRYLLSRLRGTLAGIDPDAVIVHGEPWLLFTAEIVAVCRSLSVPTIAFSWENLVRVPPMRTQRVLERATYLGFEGIIAGSDAAVERLRTRGYGGPVTVAPQTGVDTDTFVPRKDTAVREWFDLPDDPLVVYAGRLDEEKGVDLLLDSVPQVTSHHDVHYLLVGDGPRASGLRERIETEGLADNVTLITEFQPYSRMPEIVASSTVFAYPSQTVDNWAEQFGYAVAEAMSAGVPVVTTTCGALPTVVGDAGVVCPEDDANALTEEIDALLADPERRRHLGTVARERVISEFSVERVAEKHRSFVGSVVEE